MNELCDKFCKEIKSCHFEFNVLYEIRIMDSGKNFKPTLIVNLASPRSNKV